MAKSGFYTNRIRYGEMLDIFRSEGFIVDVERRYTWDSVPTPRVKMQPQFAVLDDKDLNVRDFCVLLKPFAVKMLILNVRNYALIQPVKWSP